MTETRTTRASRQRERRRGDPASSIPRVLDLPLALDFETLVARGIELAQRLSGDEWTDYNEHDPGVTLLQALCYALTDVAYRTGHADADVWLGAATDREAAARTQAIVTGLEALPSAALTTDDYRALLYANVVGLQNAWLFPGLARQEGRLRQADPLSMPPAELIPGPRPEGMVRVLVERVPLPPKLTDRNETDDSVCARAARLLHAHRGLGDDFEWPTPVPLLDIQLCGTIDIGHEETPDDVIANIIHEVQQALVPAPTVIAADQLLRDGRTPDQVFEGPPQSGGPVHFPATTWYRQLPSPARVLRAVRRAAGVRRVTDLRMRVGEPGTSGQVTSDAVTAATSGTSDAAPAGPPVRAPAHAMHEYRITRDGARWERVIARDDHTAQARDPWARPRQRRWIPRVHVGWTPACTLVVRRAGREVMVSQDRVEKGLRHIRERWHQTEAYAITRLETQDYARVPEGRDRALAQFRSFRHLLPAVYGVGLGGVPEGGAWRSDLLAEAEGARAHAARKAQARHLATYLLPFEQLVADQLAQLAGAHAHWSVTAGVASPTSPLMTYATQPLTNDPLHTDAVALPYMSPTPRDTMYPDAGMRSRDATRREQVLDHLLARHGEAFDNAALASLDDTREMAPDAADAGPRDDPRNADHLRLVRKQRMVRGIVAPEGVCWGRDRGVGIDYRFGALRRVACHGINETAPASWRVLPEQTAMERRVQALAGVDRVYVLEPLLLRPRGRALRVEFSPTSTLRAWLYGSRAALRDLASALTNGDAATEQAVLDALAQRGRGRAALPLRDGALLLDPLIDNPGDAQRVVEAFGPARPRGVAIRSERPRVVPFSLTVVHARRAHETADEALVLLDRMVRENCPAHLVPRMIDLDAADMHEFERLYSVWASAWQPRKAATVRSGGAAPADPLDLSPRVPADQASHPIAAELSAHELVEVDAAAAQLRRFLARHDARTLSTVVRD